MSQVLSNVLSAYMNNLHNVSCLCTQLVWMFTCKYKKSVIWSSLTLFYNTEKRSIREIEFKTEMPSFILIFYVSTMWGRVSMLKNYTVGRILISKELSLVSKGARTVASVHRGRESNTEHEAPQVCWTHLTLSLSKKVKDSI